MSVLIERLLQIWRRLMFLLRRGEFNRNLAEEMQFHLEMKIAANIENGMTPEAARLAAQREFGNVTHLQEQSREMWVFHWLETVWQDLCYGLRIMVRYPIFTTVAILSLALGIGANSAIFSIVDTVLLKSLPVKAPQELVVFQWYGSTDQSKLPMEMLDGNLDADEERGNQLTSTSFAYPNFEQYQKHNELFSDLFAFADLYRLNASIDGNASLIGGQIVTHNYFTGLGISPALGRTFTPEDDRGNATPTVVLSYSYWQRKFGQDPSIIDRTIYLNNNAFTIIGVAPPEFFGTLQVGSAPEVFVPMAMQTLVTPEQDNLLGKTGYWWVQIMGRLKPGVTAQQAQIGMDVILQQYVAGLPAAKDKDMLSLALTPGGQGLMELRRTFSQPLKIITVLVGLVLLIACVNVANLLLARATTRQREIALRLALGAGRWRLIRQLLTESLLLSLIGGLAGLAFAHWSTDLMLAVLPERPGNLNLNIQIDARLLGFTLGISLLTGLLFGLVPALQATRIDLTPSLKESRQDGGQSRRHLRLGRMLVVAQVAISMFLLIGAGLFIRTLQNLEQVNVGFNPQGILLFKINPALNGYKEAKLLALYQEIHAGLKALPGVSSASMSNYSLINNSSSINKFFLPNEPSKSIHLYSNGVSADFFRTMEIPLLTGREFTPLDNDKSTKVAIINESMARQAFGTENPIGKRFQPSKASSDQLEVVGVCRDAKFTDLRSEMPATYYVPYQQRLGGRICYVVKVQGDPKLQISAVRQLMQRIDPNLPLFDVKTQQEQINESIIQERQFARLTGFFGLIALLLACIGLYGIMSYSVTRRSSEIGIRMALGAQRWNIIWMIMRETLLMLGIGLAIGLTTSLMATRYIESQLYGLKPNDPLTIVGAIVILIGVVVLAGYLPARRAARVDPMVALRYE